MANMSQITTADDIEQLGTIMVVCAHPDDETYMAGGIIAAAVENGQEVVCVTATKGEAGTAYAQGYPAENLGEIRAAELEAALDELGVKTHYWLGCTDGRCCDEPEDKRAKQLAGIMQQHKPTTILTFGPDGLTGHEDHIAVSRWAGLAANNGSARPTVYHTVITKDMYDHCFKEIDKKINLFFNTDKPPIAEQSKCDIYFELDRNSMKKKEAALLAMPSQTSIVFQALTESLRNGMCGTECFVKAAEKGEDHAK